MNDLMRKDLADLRETQRREHAQMMVALARCEKLEAQAREYPRARERQFFTPAGTSSPDPNIIQIPIHLSPPSLQASGPPLLPMWVVEPTPTVESPTSHSLILLLSRSIERLEGCIESAKGLNAQSVTTAWFQERPGPFTFDILQATRKVQVPFVIKTKNSGTICDQK